MKLSAGAVVSLAATLLVAASAYADSITPIRMTTRVTLVARAHTPLKTTVAVSADPAVLDVAEGNLQVEVKLASGECGGSFQTTPGITLVNAPLNPPPRNGQGYSGSVSGSGRPTAFGTQTIAKRRMTANRYRRAARKACGPGVTLCPARSVPTTRRRAWGACTPPPCRRSPPS